MKLIERLLTRNIAGAWRHETRIAGRPAAEKLRVRARFKAHLLLPWLDEFCHEPAPLDAIRSLSAPICSTAPRHLAPRRRETARLCHGRRIPSVTHLPAGRRSGPESRSPQAGQKSVAWGRASLTPSPARPWRRPDRPSQYPGTEEADQRNGRGIERRRSDFRTWRHIDARLHGQPQIPWIQSQRTG